MQLLFVDSSVRNPNQPLNKMRYSAVLLIPIAVVGISFFLGSDAQSNQTEEPGAVLYAEFCQDCHGTNGRDFVGRTWKLGSRKEDLLRVMEEGYPLLGMPGYGATMGPEELDSLAEYVLHQAQKEKRFYPTAPRTEETSDLTIRADVIMDGLETPWGMDLTDQGGLLVTEREGRLWHFQEGVQRVVEGLPDDIIVKGQGGLMDVAFWTDNKTLESWVYLSYSKLHPDNDRLSATGLIRGRWEVADSTFRLADVETLFIATPYEKTHHHYGSRIAFGPDGMLYLTCGERGHRDTHPQSLESRPGKVHRLHPDGTIPADNPFLNIPGAEPSIWTWGHRNPQGMFVHPTTGEIWTHEHGPKGGDEINILRKGANYGWPSITFGRNYSGTIITRDTAMTGMEQPLYYWLPSIGACGLDIIDGGQWPKAWQGNLLAGSLSFEYLERLVLDQDQKVIHRENLLEDIGRVRDICTGPNGDVFVAIEGAGTVVRLIPLPKL